MVGSSGKPYGGRAITLVQTAGEARYHFRAFPDLNGKTSFKAPKGLENAAIALTTNEHEAVRWRMTKDGPLKNDREIRLGTLDKDVPEVTIIRYKAPVLVIQAIDKNGKPIKGFRPKAVYSKQIVDAKPGAFHVGRTHNVILGYQGNGRWRSSQLLPDQEFTYPESFTMVLHEARSSASARPPAISLRGIR